MQFDNALANGDFYFTFKLYDDTSVGLQVDTDLVINSVGVINGIFTTALDFGDMAFIGKNIWLDISVKNSSGTGFQQLLPRKQITSTPYAIHAQFVGADAVTGIEILNGSITSVDLASNSVGFNQIATNTVGSSEIAANAI